MCLDVQYIHISHAESLGELVVLLGHGAVIGTRPNPPWKGENLKAVDSDDVINLVSLPHAPEENYHEQCFAAKASSIRADFLFAADMHTLTICIQYKETVAPYIWHEV